jgi:hypothetical protein
MKRFFTLLTASLIGLTTFGQAFTEGNLVVVRVGDGAAAVTSSSQKVFLDEYTTAGVLVQSKEIPNTTLGSRLTLGGTASSEGFLSRSINGQYLVLAGYDINPGTTSPSNFTYNKAIAVVNNAGTIDLTTNFIYNTSSTAALRTVVSTNGTDLWYAGGTLGQFYITKGGTSGTLVSNTVTNSRVLNITNGQLYLSNASGTNPRIGSVGTGLPTTSGSTLTGLPGIPTSGGSPYQYFFADLDAMVAGVDVLYIADDGGGQGIQKYSLVGGTWTLNGLITGTSIRAVTGTVSGTVVTLYASGASATTGPGSLYSVVDNAGYNAAPSTTALPTAIATSPTNTVFRGLALAPTLNSLPLNLISFNASIINGTVKAWWSTSNEVNTASFEVERSVDGRNFVTVAQKAAKNVSGINTYEALDATPLSGLAYYRLKMIDKDGTVKYSQLVTLRNKTTTKLEVFPNPTNGALSISHSKASNGAAIRIFTMEGKLVKSINAQRDAVQTAINIAELVNGNYQIVFENNGERSVTKIVKQ